MNNMKQWQQDISNVVDKNSLDIKNLQDNSEIGKVTVRIDNIEAKDREQDVQLSNHGEQLENLFNKINTDVADTKTEINNTIEQLRLNTNNSITALKTSTDRALDTIKQNTTDSLNSLKTSIDRNIELLKSNTADSITALQTSIDRHTEELDNCVRSVNGVNADENGNVTINSLIPNQIIQSPVPLTDANLHLLDGTLLSGDGAYADYVAMMGELYNADPTATCWTTESDWQTSVTTYGECGKFVYDSVNNTLRLPKIASFVQATTTASELGTLVEAGVPNIEGGPVTSGVIWQGSGTSQVGALKAEYGIGGTAGPTTGGYSGINVSLNASNSNSIYGNSNTVQPQAIKYYFYIVVGTISKTDIQIDIDNVLTDLNGKADKDLSNVTAPTQAFKNMSVGWGMPDYSAKIQITASPFIAPSDGIVYLNTLSTERYDLITVNSIGISRSGGNSNNGNSTTIIVNVGDKITIENILSTSASLGSANIESWFVPFKGVVSNV